MTVSLRASVRNFGPFLILTASLLLVWEVAVRLLDVAGYILPPPTEIIESLINNLRSGVLLTHGWVTLQEILYGFGLAVAVALALAVLVTQWEILERSVMPLIVALQTVPTIALAPLLLTWFGFGMTSKVITTALVAFFPLLVNIVSGIQSADRERMEMFRAMGASTFQTFRMLQLPNALSYFFAGLRIAITLSIVGAIVAEFVGSQEGLGYLIQESSRGLNVSTTFAILLVLSLIGMSLVTLTGWIGSKVVFWEGKSLESVSGK